MTPDRSLKPICVGIGLIERSGAFLIRQRLDGQAMAGYWEFPGGKCEAGETPEVAVVRECREEVGVEVEVRSLFHRVVHPYPHGVVDLHYFRCRIQGSQSEPVENSGFRWVAATELLRYRFPEANDVVIEALTLESVRAKGSERHES